jgi:LPXTG-motif cell wall-anchored protein
MKKIIVLTMIICLTLSMGSYGYTNLNDGHFVKSGNVCVAYHYHNGINAGWEVIFNKYVLWDDRETLKPITPNDANGAWTKYDKTYNVKLTDAKPRYPDGLIWGYCVKVDGIKVTKGQSISTKGLTCKIEVIGKDQAGQIIYKGSLKDEKLNKNGFSTINVACESDEQANPPLFYVFDFKTCHEIVFDDSYTPLTPTSSPTTSDDITPIPSDVPTDAPTNNNGDTLPKTGESNNMTLPILGLIIVIAGTGLGMFKLKHRN